MMQFSGFLDTGTLAVLAGCLAILVMMGGVGFLLATQPTGRPRPRVAPPVTSEPEPDSWTAPALDHPRLRMNLPVSNGTYALEHEACAAQLRPLLEAGDWIAAFARLRDWDQSGTRTSQGIRHYEIGREILLASVEQASQAAPWKEANDLVEAYEALSAAHPHCHIAAALAAEAHMSVAWGLMERDAKEGPDFVQQAFAYHFEQANRLLAPHPATAHQSPLLASAQYRLCTGVPDGGSRIRAAFETWSALDPTDHRMHADHGYHMLPDWFGSVEEVMSLATQRALQLGDPDGSIAYVAMTYGNLDCEPALFGHLDHDLLRRGFAAMADRGAQEAVNSACAAALTMSDWTDGETRRAYQSLLRQLVSDHLTYLIPAIWMSSVSQVRKDLARVFEAEAKRGALLDFTQGRLRITEPRQEVPAAA